MGALLWQRCVVTKCGASLVTCAHIMVRWDSEAAGSAHLGIAGGNVVLWLALPELALWGAGSVVVGWAWSVALLLLVVLHEEDLHDGSEEEEECADDGESKGSSVQSASGVWLDGVGCLAIKSDSSRVGECDTERSFDLEGYC